MRKNNTKLIYTLIITIIFLSTMTACNFLDHKVGNIESAFKGRDVIIQTYDENSNVIDRIEGNSIHIGSNESFELKDENGNIVSKSGVISITVGGKTMMHVGSSLIIQEKGLVNVFEQYFKTANIVNNDRSVPFINKLINEVKNITTGQNLIILIRSQTGKPLATYVGEDVSYFSTDIDKSTAFIIDGKYLFVYKCDYTIYDMDLFNGVTQTD